MNHRGTWSTLSNRVRLLTLSFAQKCLDIYIYHWLYRISYPLVKGLYLLHPYRSCCIQIHHIPLGEAHLEASADGKEKTHCLLTFGYFGQTEKHPQIRDLEVCQSSSFIERLRDSPKFAQQVHWKHWILLWLSLQLFRGNERRRKRERTEAGKKGERGGGRKEKQKRKVEVRHFIAPQNICFLSYHFKCK